MHPVGGLEEWVAPFATVPAAPAKLVAPTRGTTVPRLGGHYHLPPKFAHGHAAVLAGIAVEGEEVVIIWVLLVVAVGLTQLGIDLADWALEGVPVAQVLVEADVLTVAARRLVETPAVHEVKAVKLVGPELPIV